MNKTETEPHKIAIIGGGAGGLILATRLGKLAKQQNFKNLDITLIDQSPTHIWKPLLHEIAAGTLNSFEDEIAFFTHGQTFGYNFVLGRVKNIEKEEKTVLLESLVSEQGEAIRPELAIPFDTLVIAAGSVANDFGVEGVQQHCFVLDSRPEAEQLHVRLINQLTSLKYDANISKEKPFVISVIGGGATGVELATEISAVLDYLKEFKTVENSIDNIKIRIIEAGETLLAGQDKESIEVANSAIKKDKIEILTNSRVSKIGKNAVYLSDDSKLDSNIHIWTTGIKAPSFIDQLNFGEKNRIGQIVVDEFLQIPDAPSIYVIGDCAEAKSDGERLGPRAQVAQEEAIYLFDALSNRLKNQPVSPFKFNERGSLFSLGENVATGTLQLGTKNPIHIKGRTAKIAYDMLYRKHRIEVLGWFRGVAAILRGGFSRVVSSKVKLH